MEAATPQKAIRAKRAAEPAQVEKIEMKFTRITTKTSAGSAAHAMQLDVPPSLGSNPVPLHVKQCRAAHQEESQLGASLRRLYQRAECCDVNLVCCGRSFPCHQAVLVARSETFKTGLAANGAPPTGRKEVRLVEVANPEAARFMLDYMYDIDISDPKGPHQALSVMDINRDVLRLAQKFQLPGLQERAARWVARDLTTGNVVERLAICAEFGLSDLRTRIVEQLAMNRSALREVAGSPQIMEHPELMQEILKQTAAGGEDEAALVPKRTSQLALPPAKKARGGR